MLVTEDIAELLQQQVIISYLVRDVLEMSNYMLYADRDWFTIFIMNLAGKGKEDAIPIVNLALTDFKVK